MPAKKTEKTKIVKKTTASKTVKKSETKKAKTASKTTEKKVAVTKDSKKTPKKAIKKTTKKVTASSKKPIQKKELELKKKPGLAKAILAKTPEIKIEEEITTPDKKSSAPQKAIIVSKSNGRKVVFKVGDYAVYPSHGIGKIIEIENTSVLGQNFSCYLMSFEREKLIIKIPTHSAEKIGLRHLISKTQMDEVFSILRSGVKKLKGMWSRRAQEYETKINSGDIILLAEVLRDLTRDIEDGDRSYSERIIYETATLRLASEYSAIYGIDFEDAKEKVVLTAKDKLNSEGKITKKDEFDDFDLEDSKDEDEEEEEEEEYEDEDEDEE